MVRGSLSTWIGAVTLVTALVPRQVLANSVASCQDLFRLSAKAEAQTEFEAALARWKSPAPKGMASQKKKTSTSTAIIPIAPKPAAPAALKFNVDVAPLAPLRFEASFFKKGLAKDAEIDSFGSPSEHSISQLEVTRDSIAIIRPNIAKSVLTDFGTGPLRARLNSDGTFTEIGALFSRVQHPLSVVPPKYHYTLAMNLQTSTARAVLTIDEQRESNYSGYQMGRADAFFVSPKTGFEFPSLAQESGYRFNNVVALSDTLYFTEVAKNSPHGSEGDCVFFEYDPAAFTLRRLMELSPSTGAKPVTVTLLASIMRQRRNRDVAQGSIGLDYLVTILTQTHLIRLELPDPDPSGHFLGSLSISQFENREPGMAGRRPDSQVGRNAMQVKVVATESLAPTRYYDMVMYTGDRHDQRRGDPTSETFVVNRGVDGALQSWRVQADRLSPVFYRVSGGFVAQRDGFNTVATHDFPRGHMRGLVFLSDNGDVYDANDKAAQSYGAVSIIDGNIFLIGPGAQMLHMRRMPKWP